VNEDLCAGCEDCLSACLFGALSVNGRAAVEPLRCVGCGQCVAVCPQEALILERRAGEADPPANEEAWRAARLRI
jgi:heterodisulfide reductase subunit A-like polyferredoxin